MTQLLISVKNVDESLIALHAGADVIDLKDPENGAFGALDIFTSEQIVRAINGRVKVSAAVGEHYRKVSELVDAIYVYQSIGVNIIKLAVNNLLAEPDFEIEILKITAKNIKLIAVFFVDESFDLSHLEQIAVLGFFGVMLDTKHKHKNLLLNSTENDLYLFAEACKKMHLKYGLAGSLRLIHVEQLKRLNPTYLGFRGGVCKDYKRASVLLPQSVSNIKKLLLKHNNINHTHLI